MSSSAPYSGAPLKTPEKGSKAEDWQAFLDKFADYKSPKRIEEIAELAESKALYESVHWLQKVPQAQAFAVPHRIEPAS